MGRSIRVGIAWILVVALLWTVLLRWTYLIVPAMVLLAALLLVMWMGHQCFQGGRSSFFWFVGVCVVAFLTPVLLGSPVGALRSHLGRRIALSGVLLLFAFRPRHAGDDSYDEDEDMHDEDDENDYTYDDQHAGAYTDMQSAASSAPIVHDLKKIEGVGPKIEQVLYNAGITSYAQLAQASYEHLQQLLAAAGEQFQLHDPFTRPDQAALARDGQWAQLEKFQELLDGGEYGHD